VPHRPHSIIPILLAQALENIILRFGYGYPVMIYTLLGELMNKDQVKGRVEEAKGKVKEAAGVLLDDKDMETEGNVQKNVGKVQAGFGDLKEEIKDEIKK
jgi:uncharacterized protein YjbJ (UPF0337 family)